MGGDIPKPLSLSFSMINRPMPIGDGAYSTVYKVKRVSDSQLYALKKVRLGGWGLKSLNLGENGFAI